MSTPCHVLRADGRSPDRARQLAPPFPGVPGARRLRQSDRPQRRSRSALPIPIWARPGRGRGQSSPTQSLQAQRTARDVLRSTKFQSSCDAPNRAARPRRGSASREPERSMDRRAIGRSWLWNRSVQLLKVLHGDVDDFGAVEDRRPRHHRADEAHLRQEMKNASAWKRPARAPGP